MHSLHRTLCFVQIVVGGCFLFIVFANAKLLRFHSTFRFRTCTNAPVVFIVAAFCTSFSHFVQCILVSNSIQNKMWSADTIVETLQASVEFFFLSHNEKRCGRERSCQCTVSNKSHDKWPQANNVDSKISCTLTFLLTTMPIKHSSLLTKNMTAINYTRLISGSARLLPM